MNIFTDGGNDITEAVQIMYDLVHSSMDWGSGMLDTEEMHAVIQLAIDMGWQLPKINNAADAVGVALVGAFPDHYKVHTHPAVTYDSGYVSREYYTYELIKDQA